MKPTKTKTAKPTVTPTVKPPPGVEPQDRNVAAVTGYQYDPLDLQARKGDTVIFKNKDSEWQEGHSFTIEAEGVDTGVVPPGGKETFVVSLANGVYNWKCTVVPYMVSGQLTVY